MVDEREDNSMHWADSVADELIKTKKVEKQIIATGTSLSGEPHLGSANDMIRGDAVRKALLSKGKEAELAWIADDMDPYRSVPAGFPEELNKYLGVPVALIPDPWGCHKNFVYHFEEILIKQMKDLDVKITPYFGVEMYKKGMYNDTIKQSMLKKNEIAIILNKYREKALESDWYPINIICEKCNKMVTTKILSYDQETATAEYECSTEDKIVHKKNIVNGCGHKGKISVLDGNSKLTWRVEWPARWSFLKVTCEPFGKEHAASGGSWDTAKEIVKLFNWESPVPVVYEFFQVEGGKMSKSKGNVVTVPIMLEIMKPPELKFWMYYGKIGKAREINFEQMPINVAEEFDKAERAYFGESTGNEKEDQNYKRSYELSIINTPKRLIQVPYTVAASIVQVSKGREIETLKKTGHIPQDTTPEEEKEIRIRLTNALNWVNDYAPEQYKFVVQEKMPVVNVSPAVKEILSLTADNIGKISGDELQDFIFNTSKEKNVPMQEVFKTAYLLLLNKERGPKLGNFLTSLDVDFAKKRLKEQA